MSTLMKFRVRLACKPWLRWPLVSVRHCGLDESDVFLASYPRSGNKLLRFILAEILSATPSSFDTMQRTVPEIGVHVHARPLLAGGGRLIKTHERYRRNYRRAIYIVRDIRDVVLSSFARESAMDLLDSSALDDYIRPFMEGEMSRWGAWHEHVEGWLNSSIARDGDLLLLRFEDMRRDLSGTVASALEFLGTPAPVVAIQSAIANNNVERMRASEDRSRTLPKSGVDAGRLISRGAVQGWRQKLNEKQVSAIESYAGKTLSRLGYATSFSSGVSLEQRFQVPA